MKHPNTTHLARLERLADALGPQIQARGVLQYFFCGAVLPNETMRVREMRDAWAALADDMRAGRTPDLLGVYVHVPFCPSKCRYCIYYSEPSAGRDVIDAYLARVHEEIEYLRPVFKGLTFGTWYIGGGSPTLLNVRQLDDLLRHIGEAFPRRAGGQYAFECSPRTISAAKAAVFKRRGFNRVSFGVQSVRREVLEKAGRGYQTPAMVRRTFQLLRRAGFWVNADLLFGLAGDSVESMRESLRALLKERPDQITLYDVSPSTPGAVSRVRRIPLAVLGRRLAPTIARAGYSFTVTPTCLDILSIGTLRTTFEYSYSDMTAEPWSLVGIGPTVRFYLWGALRAAYAKYPPGDRFNPEAATVLGQRVTREEEQRRFVVQSVEELEWLDPVRFAQLFGALETSAVGGTIDALVRIGRLRVKDGGYVHALRGARARFVTMLHFVDGAMLEAAERRARREPAGDGGQPEARLTLFFRGHRVALTIDAHAPGSASAHACEGYCYLLPMGEAAPEPVGAVESNMLQVFTLYFDQVVLRGRPGSVKELVDLLLENQAVLRVPGPSGPAERVTVEVHPGE